MVQRFGSAWIGIVAMALGGCGATVVTTGEGVCFDGGTGYAEGETFAAEDGCNTCTCQGDGSISCTELACGECSGPAPICDTPPPGCSASVTCGAKGGWMCEIDCTGCEGAPPIDCIAPEGCSYTGPICENGALTCGELICGPCPEPAPDCGAPPPGCTVDLVCSDTGWECVVACGGTCDSQFPVGYAKAIQIVTQYCGCQPDSPCLQVCGMTLACQGEPPTSFCSDCVQGQADVQGACAVNAVFSPECQNDFDCSSYISCVLQQG